jgi:hypothetical protein
MWATLRQVDLQSATEPILRWPCSRLSHQATADARSKNVIQDRELRHALFMGEEHLIMPSPMRFQRF